MQIIKKKGHQKFLVRVFLGRDSKGNRKLHSKVINGTKKDAQRYGREKERARDLGMPLEPTTVTVNDYLDRWLKHCEQHVRDNSHYWYTKLLACYVRPTLGARKLGQLQPLDIENLYSNLLKQGLSGRTVRHVHARIATALNQAMIWRILQTDPAALVKPPKITKNEMNYFSPEEAGRFLDAAKDDSYSALLTLALFTGLRPEEYLGLTWSELDLEGTTRGVARVRRVVTQLSKKGGGWKWSDPKSASGRRDVYFPLSLVHELRKHRLRQNELRLRTVKNYEDNDLVFATKMGTPINRKFVTTYHFKPTLRRAGLDETMRLYDLRHSYVTLSLISGVPAKVVSEQAGHSTVAFTLDHYQHVMPEEREGASDKLGQLLGGAGK